MELSSVQPTNRTATDVLRKVPELSLNSYMEGSATDKHRFIDNFFVGLKEYGFIVLKDHPIPDALLNNAHNLKR